MGIKNLLKFLSNYPELINEKYIDNYQGKKIAIDISILIYQVVIAIRNTGSDLTNDKGDITSHILGIFNKTLSFLERGIIPVYIFDGKPPNLKKKILEVRNQIRKKALEKYTDALTEADKIKYFKRSVYITKKQIDECQELLRLMGIPYIEAPEEADSQLAYLCKENLVYAVLTEDMDILTFGSPKIIRNLTNNKKIPIEIDLNKVLNKLALTYEQFIELCILFGCDYCSSLSDIKQLEVYNTYLNNKSIDKTIIELKNKGYYVTSIDYQEAKQYFINSKYEPVNDSQLMLKQPEVNKLIELLVDKYGLIRYKVINKLRKLEFFYMIYKSSSDEHPSSS